jgi:hypothetical protein
MNTTDEGLARLEELVTCWREMAANNERLAGAMLGALRVLARDVLAVANAPGDPLGPEIVRRARARAATVLQHLGDVEEHAH